MSSKKPKGIHRAAERLDAARHSFYEYGGDNGARFARFLAAHCVAPKSSEERHDWILRMHYVNLGGNIAEVLPNGQ